MVPWGSTLPWRWSIQKFRQAFPSVITSPPHPTHVEALSPLCRSTEEIIAFFISITFVLDAVKGMAKSECKSGVVVHAFN